MFLKLGNKLCEFRRPVVMGILNATDDSFYGASRASTAEDLLRSLRVAIAQGADIIDVGACSTRPGSEPVSVEKETERLGFALNIIRNENTTVPLSVDTFRAEMVVICAQYGVDIINDISGGNEEMFTKVAQYDMGYVLTHNDVYADDAKVIDYFQRRIDKLNKAGVKDVIIDPGFGFNKDVADNYRMLGLLPLLKEMSGLPVLVGMSRKSMIYKVLGGSPDEALAGTITAQTLALDRGADIIRVHDVKEAVDTVKIFMAMHNSKDIRK
ncbi:MAG: dihydropteroate synthase [Paludibacteraceae bacterium]|nr:dihydropteroate synthase [Paludibacteraceae bacterium]